MSFNYICNIVIVHHLTNYSLQFNGLYTGCLCKLSHNVCVIHDNGGSDDDNECGGHMMTVVVVVLVVVGMMHHDMGLQQSRLGLQQS